MNSSVVNTLFLIRVKSLGVIHVVDGRNDSFFFIVFLSKSWTNYFILEPNTDTRRNPSLFGWLGKWCAIFISILSFSFMTAFVKRNHFWNYISHSFVRIDIEYGAHSLLRDAKERKCRVFLWACVSHLRRVFQCWRRQKYRAGHWTSGSDNTLCAKVIQRGQQAYLQRSRCIFRNRIGSECAAEYKTNNLVSRHQ